MVKNKNNMTMSNYALTITFSECVENHVGMQKVGTIAPEGYSIEHLYTIYHNYSQKGFTCLYHDLSFNGNSAGLLIIKQFVQTSTMINSNFLAELKDEQLKLNYDKQAIMKGKLVNKLARHNLCFADFTQVPQLEIGKGTIYNFSDLPYLNYTRALINIMVNDHLLAESNLYYDVKNCGIGYHGDTERRKVVGLRLGSSIPLSFIWFKDYKPVTIPYVINTLEDGDLYIMSNKATGYDWMRPSIFTLRHAAGASKYITYKSK